MKQPLIIRSERALRGQVWEWRGLGQTMAFIPTMGGLHEGHLSLVRLGGIHAKKTIASIFVNPAQFAPDEDFESYPRDHERDIEMLASAGCDLIYIPDPHSMYSGRHATSIKVGGVAEGLETDHRPTFFDGVVLVVTKLLNRVAPDYAVFGEKDYQQLAIIRRLVADLDIPVEIIGGAIARDEAGLALSSRNQYFDADGLAIARKLNVIMRECAANLKMGHDVNVAERGARKALLAAGFDNIDYISAADADTLEVINTGQINGAARLLLAVHCKGVRLIDNFEI